MEIKARAPKANNAEATFNFDFPATALEAIEAYGDEVVNTSFIERQVVKAQAIVRQHLEAGKAPEEVTAYMEKNWKPGATMSDPTTAAINTFKNMSEEERKSFLDMLAKVATASGE
jgi:uncharacterized tellurite resistance protein B-like protein